MLIAMDNMKHIFFALMICMSMYKQTIGAWVERHQYVPNISTYETIKDTSLVFECLTKNVFCQLLFAWNAQRPPAGFFSFFVQARAADTKKWGTWHHAADWGREKQCSYLSPSDGLSSYHHVRLEMDSSVRADAFRIKIVAPTKKDMRLLKQIVATTVNHDLFVPETTEHYATKHSIYINNVPTLSQITAAHPEYMRICSPTACAMLASFLLKKKIDLFQAAHESYDSGLDSYGSWPFNMAYLAQDHNHSYLFFHTRLNSFAELYEQLCRAIPVVVSVRGHLANAPKAYPHGHLIVVTGFDAKTQELICHDPAQTTEAQVCTRYQLADFMRAWERSHRLAYYAQPIKNAPTLRARRVV